MRVEPHFVSVGVNRIVNALDWGDNGLIAYAGHHIVCVYEPVVRDITSGVTYSSNLPPTAQLGVTWLLC